MTLRIAALVLVLVSATIAAGCASLLGGLDDGTAALDAGVDAPDERDDGGAAGGHDARCVGWLAGFRHRMPIVVKHEGAAITGYQVRLALPAAVSVASERLREDRADLRVTASDGVTLLPHWLENGLDTSKTTVWTRMDIAPGSMSAWLYYGNESAPDVSSSSRTFASAIIDDPGFDREDAWTRAHEDASDRPASRTNEWSVTLGGGKATVRLFRPADPNAGLAGVCQTMLFPGGSSYRFVVDVDIVLADHAYTHLAFGGLGGASSWTTPKNQIGSIRGRESSVIDPGTATVCLVASLEGATVGQGVLATFSGVRVRRVASPEPAVTLGAEEPSPCP